MFSKLTQISRSEEAEADWRNSLGSLHRGERLGLTTDKQRNPWLQLDLAFQLFIVLVGKAEGFQFSTTYRGLELCLYGRELASATS